ncbi:MAG: DNA repair protein RecO [Bacillota bacterium]
MKEYLVDAIILKSIKAGEADRVLTLYTRQVGKKRVIAHGVEKPTSRKRGAVQPFGYSRLLLRRGRDLDSVSQGEGIEIFPGLRQSLEGLARASYLAELVDAFTLDGDPNPQIFELLRDTFMLLGGRCDFVAARAFEIKLVSLLGYRPGLEACVLCGVPAGRERVYFGAGQGGIVCGRCRSGSGGTVEISRGALENLKALMRWETGRIHQLRITPAAGKEIKNVMRRFIEYHLEKTVKSLKFEELLDGNE